MEAQRLARQALDQGLEGATAADAQRRWRVAERGQVEPRPPGPPAEPAHVHHHVTHRHGPLGVDEAAGAVRVALAHLESPELGEEPVHWVVELEQRALVQAEQGHPGDRLGHRVDAPDRVVAHRHLALAVGVAQRRRVREPPGARHQHLAPGDLARLQVAGAEVVVDAGQAPGVEAGGVGVGLQVGDDGHVGTLSSGCSTRPRF